MVYNTSFSAICSRLLPAAGEGVEAFSDAVGEVARGVDWFRGPPEPVFEVVVNENIVEVH